MRINILEVNSNIEIKAEIKPLEKKLIPLKKEGWNFNWKELFKVEGSKFFGITCLNSPNRIEGIIMLTLFYDEMLFMNNIELAPRNLGRNKKFDNIAGALLAFGCKKSFILGKGNYHGYLSFDSKTKLIELYQSKYDATHAMGSKMFFSPESGKKLMNKYLQIKK